MAHNIWWVVYFHLLKYCLIGYSCLIVAIHHVALPALLPIIIFAGDTFIVLLHCPLLYYACPLPYYGWSFLLCLLSSGLSSYLSPWVSFHLCLYLIFALFLKKMQRFGLLFYLSALYLYPRKWPFLLMLFDKHILSLHLFLFYFLIHCDRIGSDHTLTGAFIHWIIELFVKTLYMLHMFVFSCLIHRNSWLIHRNSWLIHRNSWLIHRYSWLLLWSDCVSEYSSRASAFGFIRSIAEDSRPNLCFEGTGTRRCLRCIILFNIRVLFKYSFSHGMLFRTVQGCIEFDVEMFIKIIRSSTVFILCLGNFIDIDVSFPQLILLCLSHLKVINSHWRHCNYACFSLQFSWILLLFWPFVA